jgi:hypothetical protein
MIRRVLLGASLVIVPSLSAQTVPLPIPAPTPAGTYSPTYRIPTGRQLVVVYIGMTACGHSRDHELTEAVRRMKPLLARQADSLKRPLSVNGVALDWVVDSGVVYLQSLGAWNEIGVGGQWTSLGAEKFVWKAGAYPNIPQVLVYERTVTQGKKGITFGPERRLATYVGTDEVIGWVSRGAPILARHQPQPQRRRSPAG